MARTHQTGSSSRVGGSDDGGDHHTQKMASPTDPIIKGSWSQLPIELLSVISSNLTEISDYISFRSVCSPWRSAASLGDLPPQRPRLILPYDPHSGGRSIFNLATGKLSTFDFPECRNKYVGGSAHGWLALIALDSSISLWNPITRAQIPLPSPTQFFESPLPSPTLFTCHLGPDVPRFSADSRVFGLDHSSAIVRHLPGFVHTGYPSKVFLSSNPADPGADCIVAAILVDFRHFIYCRPGDETWTVLPDILRWQIVSMVFHERRMYGVDTDGTGVVLDLDGGPDSRPTVIRSPAEYDFDPIGDSYLLKVNTEMFLILNFGINYEDQAVKMEIFKLDLNGELKWSRVQSIGDLTFFLAARHSSAVRATQFPGCKPGSLYFSGCCFRREPLGPDVHGMEIFNLNGNDYECLPVPYRGGTGIELKNPTWFTPSLR